MLRSAIMQHVKRLKLPAYGFAKKLDAERRQLLAICGEFDTFSAGEVIVNEGAVHTELFMVLEGVLLLRRHLGELSYAPLGTAKRGSTFGEMNLFHPQPARTTIIATTDGVLWKISKEQFDAMVADDLIIAREVLSWLCHTLSLRLRRATERYITTKGEYDHLFDELMEEPAQAAPPPAEGETPANEVPPANAEAAEPEPTT